MRHIEHAIEAAGGVSALADKLGVKPPTVSQWRSSVRPVPPRLALRIEGLTGVSRHGLRPDIFGQAPAAPKEAA